MAFDDTLLARCLVGISATNNGAKLNFSTKF